MLFTFVAAIFTYIEFEPRLSSSRPAGGGDAVSSLIGDQKFSSRLWQDPLGESLKASPQDLTEWSIMGSQIQNFIDQKYNCSVMAVMVEGFSYPEDVEVRLRLRYAVQTALASENYKPNDRSHLGLASVGWPVGARLFATNNSTADPQKDTSKSDEGGKLLIPFEWFLADDLNTNKSAILVLWLKEEEFADYPLTRFARLFEKLNLPATNSTQIKLIGPRSSDTLARMVLDTNVQPFRVLLTNFVIYSSEATAPDALIMPRGTINYCTNSSRAKIEQAICANLGRNGAFTNLIVTDEELSRQLVQELVFRGVDTTPDSGDHIVLISETDTSYGRSLPICFAGMASDTNSPPVCALSKFLLKVDKWPTNFLRFAYLRGLDGTLAKTESKPAESKNAGSAPANPRAIRSLDEYAKSEGESQFDYARRLTKELELKNELLKKGGKKIRAIGVLGSDIYDKLILLQALRASFGDAVFFTTDLDARYLDPEQNPITRNLIVASSYGLQPDCSLKPAIPRVTPFRDCYQTAVFTACLNALGEPSARKGPIRMFEVGRTRAVELGCAGRAVHDDLFQNLDISPRKIWGFAMILIGAIGTLALLRSVSRFLADHYHLVFQRLHLFVRSLLPMRVASAVATAQMNTTIASQTPNTPTTNTTSLEFRLVAIERRMSFWTSVILLMGMVFIMGIMWVAWVQRGQPDAEPIKFNEGVSIWPTEILRLVAGVLSFLFVVRSWFLYKRHRLKLRDKYFAHSESPASVSTKRNLAESCKCLFDALRSWCKSASFTSLKKWRTDCSINFWPKPDGNVDAQKLYEAFLIRGKLSNRLCRIIPTCISYLLLGFGVFLIFGFPNVPSRGHVSALVDRLMLVSSILGYSFLAFYVVDATRLTERFITCLSEQKTTWPDKILKSYAEDRHMDPDHLPGYLDVEFVGLHTKAIGKLFKFPFIVLSIMWIARNKFFDNWTWPLPMSIIFGLNAIIVFLCAFLIRRAAAQVRKAAVADLQKIELKSMEASHKPHTWTVVDETGHRQTLQATNYAEKVRHLIEEISSVSMGSYTSWIKDSAVQALLIPGVGYGLITLFEKLVF